MIKKEITYDNLDGQTVTEAHYFHLSMAELVEMETSEVDGMATKLQAIATSGDAKRIMSEFTAIVGKCYGKREGDRFVKSEEITKEFLGSMAFDTFFGQLVTDADFASDFVNGIMPKNLMERVAKNATQPDFMKLANERFLTGESMSPQARVQSEIVKAFDDEASGLKHPRDEKGELLPWAFRKPHAPELHSMTRAQLEDVTLRMNSHWAPPE